MTAHPVQGANNNTWGTDQTAWDFTEHNADGTHKSQVLYQGTPASVGAASANVTAWNSAVSTLPAAGGVIFIPAGVYSINAALQIQRNNVRVVAAPGAVIQNTIGMYDVAFLVNDVVGSTLITDVHIYGLTVDGQGYTLDMANTPGTLGTTDSRFGGGTYSRTATSGSTTTFVVSGANWPVNRFAGLFLQISSGATNVNLNRAIISNTATTITTAAFPATLSGNVGWVLTQQAWANRSASTWGQTFGHSGIIMRNCAMSSVEHCKMLNYFNTGQTWNSSGGSVATLNSYFEHIGPSHVWDATSQPNNPVDIIGTTTLDTDRVGHGMRIENCHIERCYGVSIDAHGAGAQSVYVRGNTISGFPFIPSASPWGIACEIESEIQNNCYVEISDNIISEMPIGIIMASNGVVTPFHVGINCHDNIIYAGGTNSIGITLAGRGIQCTDNYVEAHWAIDASQTFGSGSIHQDWQIDGNQLVESGANGSTFNLRCQGGTTYKRVRFSNNKCYSADGTGQGVYCSTVDGTGVITDVLVEGNEFHNFNNSIWLNNESITTQPTGVRLINNEYIDCVSQDFVLAGGVATEIIGGKIIRPGASSATDLGTIARVAVVQDLRGYNDVYAEAAITVTTGTFTVPTVTRERMMTVTGGTVTAISIGGTSTGRTSGTFRLLGGVAMVITNSVAPTLIAESY